MSVHPVEDSHVHVPRTCSEPGPIHAGGPMHRSNTLPQAREMWTNCDVIVYRPDADLGSIRRHRLGWSALWTRTWNC